MEKQVRRGVFETNSSSVHSIVMCTESDYDRWEKGEVLLFGGSEWGYPDDKCPKKDHFYTLEEAIEFEKASNYPPGENMDWNDKESVIEYLREDEWYTYENFNYRNFEEFEETYTTPSGEKVVAFGYYGEDR